jgi:hypothetical protein
MFNADCYSPIGPWDRKQRHCTRVDDYPAHTTYPKLGTVTYFEFCK